MPTSNHEFLIGCQKDIKTAIHDTRVAVIGKNIDLIIIINYYFIV